MAGKKAVSSSIFTYILVALLAVIIILTGYQVITQASLQSESSKTVILESKLKTDISNPQLANNLVRYNVPQSYKKICFLDADAGNLADPKHPFNTPGNRLMVDSAVQGSSNVFFVSEDGGIRPASIPGFVLDPRFHGVLCLDAVAGSAVLRTKNFVSATLIERDAGFAGMSVVCKPAQSSGNCASPDYGLAVSLPANSGVGELVISTVSTEQLRLEGLWPEGLDSGNALVYEFDSSTQPAVPVKITMLYSPSFPEGQPPVIYHYHNSVLEPVNYRVLDSHFLEFEISGFSYLIAGEIGDISLGAERAVEGDGSLGCGADIMWKYASGSGEYQLEYALLKINPSVSVIQDVSSLEAVIDSGEILPEACVASLTITALADCVKSQLGAGVSVVPTTGVWPSSGTLDDDSFHGGAYNGYVGLSDNEGYSSTGTSSFIYVMLGATTQDVNDQGKGVVFSNPDLLSVDCSGSAGGSEGDVTRYPGCVPPFMYTPATDSLTVNNGVLYYNRQIIKLVGYSSYPEASMVDFAYQDYINDMPNYGINLIRLWAVNPPGYDGFVAYMPFAKNPDGKYDLSTYDSTYFGRLKDFVALADQKGIIVEYALFDNWAMTVRDPWLANPFNGNNNINQGPNYECPATGNCDSIPGRFRFYEIYNSDSTLNAWGSLLKNYVQYIVHELGSKNVMYELMNEPAASLAVASDGETYQQKANKFLSAVAAWIKEEDPSAVVYTMPVVVLTSGWDYFDDETHLADVNVDVVDYHYGKPHWGNYGNWINVNCNGEDMGVVEGPHDSANIPSSISHLNELGKAVILDDDGAYVTEPADCAIPVRDKPSRLKDWAKTTLLYGAAGFNHKGLTTDAWITKNYQNPGYVPNRDTLNALKLAVFEYQAVCSGSSNVDPVPPSYGADLGSSPEGYSLCQQNGVCEHNIGESFYTCPADCPSNPSPAYPINEGAGGHIQCSDGVDNDNDGCIDYISAVGGLQDPSWPRHGRDPGCLLSGDGTELDYTRLPPDYTAISGTHLEPGRVCNCNGICDPWEKAPVVGDFGWDTSGWHWGQFCMDCVDSSGRYTGEDSGVPAGDSDTPGGGGSGGSTPGTGTYSNVPDVTLNYGGGLAGVHDLISRPNIQLPYGVLEEGTNFAHIAWFEGGNSLHYAKVDLSSGTTSNEKSWDRRYSNGGWMVGNWFGPSIAYDSATGKAHIFWGEGKGFDSQADCEANSIPGTDCSTNNHGYPFLMFFDRYVNTGMTNPLSLYIGAYKQPYVVGNKLILTAGDGQFNTASTGCTCTSNDFDDGACWDFQDAVVNLDSGGAFTNNDFTFAGGHRNRVITNNHCGWKHLNSEVIHAGNSYYAITAGNGLLLQKMTSSWAKDTSAPQITKQATSAGYFGKGLSTRKDDGSVEVYYLEHGWVEGTDPNTEHDDYGTCKNIKKIVVPPDAASANELSVETVADLKVNGQALACPFAPTNVIKGVYYNNIPYVVFWQTAKHGNKLEYNLLMKKGNDNIQLIDKFEVDYVSLYGASHAVFAANDGVYVVFSKPNALKIVKLP